MARNTRRAILLGVANGPELVIPGPTAVKVTASAVCCTCGEGREDTRRRVILTYEMGDASVHAVSLHPADAKALYEALHDALHVVQVAQEPPREHWSRR